MSRQKNALVPLNNDNFGGKLPRPVIAYEPPDNLKPNPSNPRKHDRAQLRRLAKSIRSFGFLVPVIGDGAGNIVCGHARTEAAKICGLTEIPVIRVEHLSEAQLRAFMIADNRLNELSNWDDPNLAEHLRFLSTIDCGFDIEATGFDIPEIDLKIGALEVKDKAGPDPADKVPDNAPGEPITRLGDCWQLGRHRVICGSALNYEVYAALMHGELAAMMFADPPYNVPIDGHASGLGKVRHRDFTMASGEMSQDDFTRFLVCFAELATRHSGDGAIHYVCIDWRHLPEMIAMSEQVYSDLKNVCVWAKHNAGMGSFYRSQHELVFVFKHGTGRHRNNVQLGQYGRHRSNVWSYRGLNDFGRTTDEGNLLALHPTVKPVALVADAILDCSARGEIVLDPFLGSGTTVIAAERTGRQCRGIELDPLYVDTAIRRWQAFTGDAAVLIATGETFGDLETKRGQHNAKA